MFTAKNRNAIIMTQQITALRIIRAYRIVSDAASLMLARMLLGELLARERIAIGNRKKATDRTETNDTIKVQERTRTIEQWQQQ